MQTPSNEEKERVWQAYHNRKPVRVPHTLGAGPRVVLLDEKLNTKGITFEDYFTNPHALIEAQIAFKQYEASFLNRFCDRPVKDELDGVAFWIDNQNIYDAAYFGCPLTFRDGQVPDTTPILQGAAKHRIFDFDADHPLDNPYVQSVLERYESVKDAAGKISDGKTYSVDKPLLWFDGTLTAAASLRGTDIFLDFIEDPPYVKKLLTFIQHAVMKRNKAVAGHFGVVQFSGDYGWHADDSIQLISTDAYREFVLPLHCEWYAQWPGSGPHSVHLCGNVQRHLPILRDELNVKSFDTGFPVDHGQLRKDLGPGVDIQGGPEVGILVNGTSGDVYNRTKEILTSGIKEGGRFQLREGNNLPPRVPEANLAAMYQACLDHGWHE